MRPVQTRFRFGYALRLNLAGHCNSQAHYAKGTRSHVACAIVLPRLVDIRFQSLFTPFAGVLFTFPSRYWFTIGHQVVLSLGRWSSRIPTGFLVSRRTQEPARLTPVSPTGLSPSLAGLPRPFDYLCESTLLALQPHFKLEVVWAGPRSLATTSGVSFDFFS